MPHAGGTGLVVSKYEQKALTCAAQTAWVTSTRALVPTVIHSLMEESISSDRDGLVFGVGIGPKYLLCTARPPPMADCLMDVLVGRMAHNSSRVRCETLHDRRRFSDWIDGVVPWWLLSVGLEMAPLGLSALPAPMPLPFWWLSYLFSCFAKTCCLALSRPGPHHGPG